MQNDEKEANLFNATETLAQFYDEIDSFMGILFSDLKRNGFTAKGERLRSGTFGIRNLTRRLLATATVFYIRGTTESEEAIDDDDDDAGDEDEDEGMEKPGKKNVPISSDGRIPFVHLALFEPRAIPSRNTMTSPTLWVGALGEFRFVESKSGQPVTPPEPMLALSNLANINLQKSLKQGGELRCKIWSPPHMKKFKVLTKVVALEKRRLLEINSHERIRELAERLSQFGNSTA